MTSPHFSVRIGLLGIAFALAQPAVGSAQNPAPDPCALLTSQEATTLLGGPAEPAKAHSLVQSCIIAAHAVPDDRLMVTLTTIAPEDATRLLKHLDDERGDEIPSLHGEPWYEQSVVDPAHPLDRTFVIVRDRTNLTLQLHSSRQKDVVAAFERVWLAIALRLPTDEQP
jgi:hypothetical protein